MKKQKEGFGVLFARKGGIARAQKLTAEQRRASASNAARARWQRNTSGMFSTSDPQGGISKVPAAVTEDALSFSVHDVGLATEFDNLIRRKFADFLERRSPKDYEFYKQHAIRLYPESSSNKLGTEQRDRILTLLDEFILSQARSIGPRVLFNHDVRCRLVEWGELKEQPNAELHKKLKELGKSMTHYAAVRKGLEKEPLRDPELRQFAKEVQIELKLLAKIVRSSGLLDKKINQTSLFSFVRANISLDSSPFERLNANLKDFIEYCQEDWENVTGWLRKRRGLTTALIAYRFIAHSTGYANPESARKAISRLRPLRLV